MKYHLHTTSVSLWTLLLLIVESIDAVSSYSLASLLGVDVWSPRCAVDKGLAKLRRLLNCVNVGWRVILHLMIPCVGRVGY